MKHMHMKYFYNFIFFIKTQFDQHPINQVTREIVIQANVFCIIRSCMSDHKIMSVRPAVMHNANMHHRNCNIVKVKGKNIALGNEIGDLSRPGYNNYHLRHEPWTPRRKSNNGVAYFGSIPLFFLRKLDIYWVGGEDVRLSPLFSSQVCDKNVHTNNHLWWREGMLVFTKSAKHKVQRATRGKLQQLKIYTRLNERHKNVPYHQLGKITPRYHTRRGSALNMKAKAVKM